MDRYLEGWRWEKAQSKALIRDWEREKLELKDKIMNSIEHEIKETEDKI